jgi:predicted nucleic acid-binding Zn ribbon protein
MGRTHLIGDIELTEYDFHCPSCGNTIPFDEQCVMERIQKSVGRVVLTKEEIESNSEEIRSVLEREKKTRKNILQAIWIAALVLMLWRQSKA